MPRPVPQGRQSLLVLNQAGWHTIPGLPQFAKRIAVVAASGSPEKNPVEQVWEQLRGRSLVHRCHDSYGHIVDKDQVLELVWGNLRPVLLACQ